MCGWWRTHPYGVSRRTGEIRQVKFDVDVETRPMLRVEQLSGAGRNSPNAKIDVVDSKMLNELPEELKDQIRRQAERILAVLE
jgi:hypothetical protein